MMADPTVPQQSEMQIAGNYGEGTLNASIGPAVTAIVLVGATGADAYPDVFPYPVANRTSREIMLVTSKTGTTTLNVVREQEGTSAFATSLAGSEIRLIVTAKMYNDLLSMVKRNQKCSTASGGALVDTIGVIDTGDVDTNMFKTTEQGTPDMTVLVQPGLGVINHEYAELDTAETSPTIVAPVADKRVDLLEWLLGTGLNIVTGTPHTSAPVAPSPSANAIPLYEIGQSGNFLETTTTSIINAMLVDLRGNAIL